MITTKLYLDTRAVKDGEPAPLKVAITKKRQAAYIPLGVKLKKEQWDAKKQRIVDAPNKQRLELFVKNKLVEIDNAILELQMKGELTKQTSTQIKNKVVAYLDPDVKKKDLFINRYIEYMNSRSAQRTREIYATTLKKMRDFDSKVDTYAFEDISKDWLKRLDAELVRQGLKKNSRNIHFRNIRAVFNDAIDNEITSHYPMRTFDINPEQTEKRSLTVDELRTLFNYNVQPWQQKYLDYFKLTFFLIGINPADILNCTDENVVDGRLLYRRKKTGRLYSIRLEPEAIQIINRYRGKTNLVNFSENMRNYKQFVCKANKGLKAIGPVTKEKNEKKKVHDFQKEYHTKHNPLFAHISLYWARHTWATIAFSIGIPEEIIAEALGHSHGNRTTAIYIDKSVANIDAANRKVLNYVLYKEQPKD
jgi:integrase